MTEFVAKYQLVKTPEKELFMTSTQCGACDFGADDGYICMAPKCFTDECDHGENGHFDLIDSCVNRQK